MFVYRYFSVIYLHLSDIVESKNSGGFLFSCKNICVFQKKAVLLQLKRDSNTTLCGSNRTTFVLFLIQK